MSILKVFHYVSGKRRKLQNMDKNQMQKNRDFLSLKQAGHEDTAGNAEYC